MMATRVQDSPFRETEWDQRLDKMLDDLKTTVSPDNRPSSRVRDNTLVSSFSTNQRRSRPNSTFLEEYMRSSSRSDSRSSNKGVDDGGQMKHKHSEYTSPDHSTRVVTDEYSYNSGDMKASSPFQKKVVQSTYSSYNVKGDLTSNLDELQKGPSQTEMDIASKDTKVVSASQKVANKLVDALASIGQSPYSNEYFRAKYSKGSSLVNREEEPEDKGSEVRRIVWRNRFEKTCEAQDSSDTPTISIEEAAKAAQRARNQPDFSFTKSSDSPTVVNALNTSYSSSSTSKNKAENLYKRLDVNDSTRGRSPPRFDGPSSFPSKPDKPSSSHPSSNISIQINKHTTHTTHTKDFPGSGPVTSTPFTTPGRSRSASPEKPDIPKTKGSVFPPGQPTYHTSSHFYSSTRRSETTADSLERLKRPTSEGLPFPETSPIKAPEENAIPRRVDDLMTSFSDSETGPDMHNGPLLNGPHRPYEREPLVTKARETEITTTTELIKKDDEKQRELTKNVAGAPVYYPPGHQQLFTESMHTMTLKENKRRGMAKWRMEKESGMKESSAHSDSKGGMAMVPVCLPLCCGAACAIM